MDDIVSAFHAAMVENIYLAVLRECRYDARSFLVMIATSDGLKTAKLLLKKGSVQTGFRGLRRKGLDANAPRYVHGCHLVGYNRLSAAKAETAPALMGRPFEWGLMRLVMEVKR